MPLLSGQKPWNVCLRLWLWTPAYWQGYVRIPACKDSFVMPEVCNNLTTYKWNGLSSLLLKSILFSAGNASYLEMFFTSVCADTLVRSAVRHAAWRSWPFDGQLHKCERGGCRAVGKICAQQTSTYWAILWHAHREDTGKLLNQTFCTSLCCEVSQFLLNLHM